MQAEQTTTNRNDHASDWLTVPEAAARIKASPRSLYRAIKTGDLRAARINLRGDLRIAASWLNEWLARQATNTTRTC